MCVIVIRPKMCIQGEAEMLLELYLWWYSSDIEGRRFEGTIHCTKSAMCPNMRGFKRLMSFFHIWVWDLKPGAWYVHVVSFLGILLAVHASLLSLIHGWGVYLCRKVVWRWLCVIKDPSWPGYCLSWQLLIKM